jgi:CBS domain-containing protein
MLSVASIMRRDPESVPPDMPVPRLEELFLESGYAGFPVVAADRLVGIVSRSDIVRSLLTERSRAEQTISGFYAPMGLPSDEEIQRDLESIASRVGVRLASLSVDDVMIRNVVTIESDRSVTELAGLMQEGRLHRLPVVEGERLVGLVTSMDIVRAVAEGRLVASDSTIPTSRRLAGQ